MYSLYQSWKNTGKSRARFAKENGLVLSAFYYWTKKFSRNGKEETAPVGGFGKLDVAPSPGQTATARISYPSGITVELYGIPDRDLIRSLTQ